MAPKMEYAVLHNGVKMPLLGYGTHQATEGNLKESMDAAFDAGYRHFDTAAAYQNEKEIGEVLHSWLSSGKVKREELFIVTKLPPAGNRAENVEMWMKRSLERLQLDYVDLYLIHKPFGFKGKGDDLAVLDKDGNILYDLETDHISLWKAMEAQVDAGRTKAIGLSDFNERQIQRILDNCRIKPANLQTELHIIYQRKSLVDFCHKNGITVVAFAPLGSPGKKEFFKGVFIPDLMSHPVVLEVAKRHGKSPAQILLKQIVQRGVSAIPKSVNPKRIRENIDIFDFKLSKDEVEKLAAIDKGDAGKIFVLHLSVMKGVEVHPEYNYRGFKTQTQ